MKIYQPLPYRNGAEILKGPYEKEGQTKNPIIGSNVKEKLQNKADSLALPPCFVLKL